MSRHDSLIFLWRRRVYGGGSCKVAKVSKQVVMSFCVAGVVLGDIDFHFAWQAWHLWHWTGSGGTLGPEWTRWSPRLLAWQAWHLETSTFVSRGKRDTW